MTDDTPNRTTEDDLFAQDESSVHRSVAGRAGTGKTAHLISWAGAHRDESTTLIDPKGDDVDVIDGSGN